MKHETTIEISDAKHYRQCDGCGKKYAKDEKVIGSIESCCGGGCWRSLCFDCIRAAIKMIEATP